MSGRLGFSGGRSDIVGTERRMGKEGFKENRFEINWGEDTLKLENVSANLNFVRFWVLLPLSFLSPSNLVKLFPPLRFCGRFRSVLSVFYLFFPVWKILFQQYLRF